MPPRRTQELLHTFRSLSTRTLKITPCRNIARRGRERRLDAVADGRKRADQLPSQVSLAGGGGVGVNGRSLADAVAVSPAYAAAPGNPIGSFAPHKMVILDFGSWFACRDFALARAVRQEGCQRAVPMTGRRQLSVARRTSQMRGAWFGA